jgi:hypothetical protein
MAIGAPEKSIADRQDDPKRINNNQTNSRAKPNSKGSMREPAQQAAAAGNQEELKQALQELEEKKGDWSKGG